MRFFSFLAVGLALIGSCASAPTPKPLGRQNLAVDARPVQRDNEPVADTIDMQASGEGVGMRQNQPPTKKPSTASTPAGETAGELQLQENPVVPPPPETALGH